MTLENTIEGERRFQKRSKAGWLKTAVATGAALAAGYLGLGQAPEPVQAGGAGRNKTQVQLDVTEHAKDVDVQKIGRTLKDRKTIARDIALDASIDLPKGNYVAVVELDNGQTYEHPFIVDGSVKKQTLESDAPPFLPGVFDTVTGKPIVQFAYIPEKGVFMSTKPLTPRLAREMVMLHAKYAKDNAFEDHRFPEVDGTRIFSLEKGLLVPNEKVMGGSEYEVPLFGVQRQKGDVSGDLQRRWSAGEMLGRVLGELRTKWNGEQLSYGFPTEEEFRAGAHSVFDEEIAAKGVRGLSRYHQKLASADNPYTVVQLDKAAAHSELEGMLTVPTELAPLVVSKVENPHPERFTLARGYDGGIEVKGDVRAQDGLGPAGEGAQAIGYRMVIRPKSHDVARRIKANGDRVVNPED